ncbi:MAG: cytochrome c maturation protein CcmE [Chloroflexota bacterium]
MIAAVLSFMVYQGISNNLVYYITPSELLAKGAQAEGQNFRLGGQVRSGSVRWNRSSQVLRFVLQDPRGSVTVTSHGVPPALFKPGSGCVVEGLFSHHLFTATNLMIKHGSNYRAPKPGQVPAPDHYVSK